MEYLEVVVKIRPYKAQDAPEICRLFYETVHSVNSSDYSKKQLHAWAPEIPDPSAWHARMSGRHTLVAEYGGEVVCFAELEHDGHLDMFYCRRDTVSQGAGTQLYEALEQRARQGGLERLFTEASITARPFFERQGFVTVKQQSVERQGVELTNFAMDKSLAENE